MAVAAGLPMLVGAWFDQVAYASLASIGAMTILHVPRTRLDHRMVTMMAAAFAMIACYAFGLVSQLVPEIRVPIIMLVSLLVVMGCQYFRVGPPGALFFVMATAIGAFTPGQLAQTPMKLGIFALGAIGAVIIAFFYNLHILRFREPQPPASPPADLLDEVVVHSVIVGLFVGLSLLAAQLLALDKPYWVPVSCLAVIQTSTLRAAWERQIHRIVGTAIGLVVTWALVRYATDAWAVAIAVTLLTFCIETAIVRHYAFAALFITPLTILLAEASTVSGVPDSSALIVARLADTVLGSLIGLVGGVCLHSRAIRRTIGRWLRALPLYRQRK